jgi:hypothetical protein
MEQPQIHAGDGLERILNRLARHAGPAPRTPPSPESSPHWEALELLAPAARAAALDRILRGNLQLADQPRAHRERLFDPKPLLFTTAEELLARPVSAHPREAAALPIALLSAQYEVELRAVHSCSRARADFDLLATFIAAALTSLWQLLLGYWRRQLPVPERLWNELHALYQLACATRIERPGASHPRALGIRTTYLKPLLLGSLNPTRFRGAEIKQIAAFLDCYADRARLGGKAGLLVVDPDSARPPGYAGKQDVTGCSRLCVRGLVQALDEDATNRGLLVPRLVRDLGRYWTRVQVRGELHRRAEDRVQLAVGLERAHRALTGCEDDDSFPEHLSPATAATAGHGADRSWLHARYRDRSAAGAQLRLRGTPEQISPGGLVAALEATGWRLGLLRWTQLTPEFDTSAGLHWLPDGFEPAAVRNLDLSLPAPFLRAFLLPGTAAERDHELILPSGMFKPADYVRARTVGTEVSLSLTAVLDMTFHITRFSAQVISATTS